ncbi:hypothetical protein DL771_004836 [Monosporascus sp. 5C6A]|nr:hypothetical protein DL771_004836 [Monosporascus sp. 5C6A]
MNLTVLVNNAGGGPFDPTRSPIRESPEAKIIGNISLDAPFPLYLMRVLLPNLIQHSPPPVINISTVADPSFPLIPSYSTSEALIMVAARALRLEMGMEEGPGDEVEILGIKVGAVTGALSMVFQGPGAPGKGLDEGTRGKAKEPLIPFPDPSWFEIG